MTPETTPLEVQRLRDRLSVKAVWWPVYFEPMPGSGERLTALVAAVDSSGRHQVRVTLRDSVLRALYGGKAEGVIQIVRIAADSLSRHLESSSDARQWLSPLTGFFVGEQDHARSDGLDGVIRQATRMCASFGVIQAVSQTESDSELAGLQWRDAVKAQLAGNTPELVAFFDKKVALRDEKMSVRIGFMNDRYAAQFGVLRHSATRVQRDVMNLKGRIIDLAQLQGDLFAYAENREIIIGYADARKFGLSAKDTLRIRSKISFITAQADAVNISVRATPDPEEAAEWVRKRAA